MSRFREKEMTIYSAICSITLIYSQQINSKTRPPPLALQLCLVSCHLHCLLLPMPSPLRRLLLQASCLHRSCCLFPSDSITSEGDVPAYHCALLPAKPCSQTSRAGWRQARRAALVPHQLGTMSQLLPQKPIPFFKEGWKKEEEKACDLPQWCCATCLYSSSQIKHNTLLTSLQNSSRAQTPIFHLIQLLVTHTQNAHTFPPKKKQTTKPGRPPRRIFPRFMSTMKG